MTIDDKDRITLSDLAAQRQTGLVCTQCGCRHIYVYHTDTRKTYVIRYRKCRYCGKTYTTIERLK